MKRVKLYHNGEGNPITVDENQAKSLKKKGWSTVKKTKTGAK